MQPLSFDYIPDDNLLELTSILINENISTLFQPIISLHTGDVLGYEALSRGPVTSFLHSPDKLFAVAEEYNKTWDLELLCRIKAIEGAKNLPLNTLLFINVDPNIFKDEKFSKGFTKAFLANHHVSHESIIFEITEKTCITDYKSFKKAIDNYVEQGYKIAIDDTGSGYSGLKMLTEVQPHYVKIDMDLIRNIDRDTFKQALLECFVKLAQITNMKLIAEGIETEAELKTLIKLGIYAGQGYFLSRPSSSFVTTPVPLKKLILNYKHSKEYRYFACGTNSIGELVQSNKAFDISTQCGTIKSFFNQEPDITGVCILEHNHPVGLVTKSSLDSVLAKPYGVSIFTNRSISLIVNQEAMIVDYYTSVSEVAKTAMQRPTSMMYDYIIVTRDNLYYGIVTVKSLLEFTNALEYNYARELSPLTGLPGNSTIENIIRYNLFSNIHCSVLYFDLDNFKIFNDTYGFEKGDLVIKYTAKLIEAKLNEFSFSSSFLGHIGGDDFVCIIDSPLQDCHSFCQSLLNQFDSEILSFFGDTHKKQGYIEGKDRLGIPTRFPLTTLSIAGIHGYLSSLSSYENISSKIASLKKQAKRIKGSSYTLEAL